MQIAIQFSSIRQREICAKFESERSPQAKASLDILMTQFTLNVHTNYLNIIFLCRFLD